MPHHLSDTYGGNRLWKAKSGLRTFRWQWIQKTPLREKRGVWMVSENGSLFKDPSISLWMLLRQTNLLVAKARQRELSKFGISKEASSVLLTISQFGKQATPSSIARRLFIERHSVSQLLTRMDLDLLIHKSRDPDMRNRIRIEFTAKGKEIFVKSSKQRVVRMLLDSVPSSGVNLPSCDPSTFTSVMP
jgi:DNA-binding MarR family transcriptional regulator